MKNRTDILKYIDNLSIVNKDKLKSYCIDYCFSWLPIGIKKREPHKQLCDKKVLETYQQQGKEKVDKSMKSKMKSDFYKNEMDNMLKTVRTDGEIKILMDKFTEDDKQIVLALLCIRSDVWSNRISSVWAAIISIVSLLVSLASISISFTISKTIP